MGRSRRDKIRGLPRNFYVSCAIYILIGGGLGAALGLNVQSSRVAEGVSETVYVEVTPTPAPPVAAAIPAVVVTGTPELVSFKTPVATAVPRATIAIPSPAPDRAPQSSPFVFAGRRGRS